ncbi:MAG: hypothetical protein ABW154_06600 [Dyella sp.]
MSSLPISQVDAAGFAWLWPIVRQVIAAGDTFVNAPDLDPPDACAPRSTPPARTFRAERDSDVVGGYMRNPTSRTWAITSPTPDTSSPRRRVARASRWHEADTRSRSPVGTALPPCV